MSIGQLSTNRALNLQLGTYGSLLVNDTNPVTGSFGRISVVSAAVFASLTSPTLTLQGTVVSGSSFPANFELQGEFTTFALKSGTIMAYNIAPELSYSAT